MPLMKSIRPLNLCSAVPAGRAVVPARRFCPGERQSQDQPKAPVNYDPRAAGSRCRSMPVMLLWSSPPVVSEESGAFTALAGWDEPNPQLVAPVVAAIGLGLGTGAPGTVAHDGGDAGDDQEERARQEAKPRDMADHVDNAVVAGADGSGDDGQCEGGAGQGRE
jgi:hypothetical protein